MSNFTELNRKHWDEQAATYNSRGDNVYEVISEELRARLRWIDADWSTLDADTEQPTKPARLLDYACGPGMVSRALAPYLTSTCGIDLSPSMIEQYNLIAHNQNLSSSEMHGVVGNLLDPADPSPAHLQGEEWCGFEIAAVGLGFHHFEDPAWAAKQLASRLRRGGVLMVIDFVTHEPIAGHHVAHDHAHNHNHNHEHKEHNKDEKTKYLFGDFAYKDDDKEMKTIAATVKHHGFGEADMKKIFEDAGCGGEFGWSVIERDITFKTATKSMVRRVFVARGTKV